MKRVPFIMVLLLSTFPVFAGNKDYSDWWLYSYGDYTKTKGENDPRVRWTFAVFERVKGVADKTGNRSPRLFIINSKFGPYAVSLPDGGIIINPKTLDICYEGEDRTKGNSRLAFILGHELAHLANDDFMHREAFLALEKWDNKKAKKELIKYLKLSDPGKFDEYKEKEMLADKKGALYTAMAGYEVAGLFWGKDNFLQHWAKQTGIGMFYDDDPLHPSLINRLHFIQSQLQAVANQLELFKAGVLLYQMGNYHDGAAVFHEFSKVYPAREVFNNIGACHFNGVMHHLYLKYREIYHKFRISTSIDYSTTAAAIQPRVAADYLKDKEISTYINKAENSFRRAVDCDPNNKTSRCNLASVLILKREYAKAQGECDYILKIDEKDVKAMNNKAIAFYYYGKEMELDTTPKVIEILEKAYKMEPGNFEVLYNLVALKQERERLAGARVYWEKYLGLPGIPRDNFYIYVCQKLRKETSETFPVPGNEVQLPAIPGGVCIGEDFSRIEKKWGKESTRTYQLGNEKSSKSNQWFLELQVMVKNNVRIIAVDGMVELVEKELPGIKSIKEMLQEFGPQQQVVNHTSGNFYIYNNKGFSFKEINRKICSYIWFAKSF
jgi:tetratricopeptide (TPR) repeat protein